VTLEPGSYAVDVRVSDDAAFTAWLQANKGAVGVERVIPSSEADAPHAYQLRVTEPVSWDLYGKPHLLRPGETLESYSNPVSDPAYDPGDPAEPVRDVMSSALDVLKVAAGIYLGVKLLEAFQKSKSES